MAENEGLDQRIGFSSSKRATEVLEILFNPNPLTIFKATFCLCALAALLNSSNIVAQEAAGDPDDNLDWVAIPAFKFNDDAGFVYGAKVELIQKSGAIKPYDWALQLKLNHSTRNRHEHRLLFDKLDFLGSGVRLGLLAEFISIEDANFFGIGNRTKNTNNEKFYQYGLSAPIFQLQGRRKIRGDFFVGGGFGFFKTFINIKSGTLLDQRRPPGSGGDHGTLGLLFVGFDSRDNELTPHTGHFTELYIKATSDKVLSSRSFFGIGLQQRSYFELASWAVLAQRIAFEDLGGDVPFYMMSIIGGSRPVFALGGSYSQRGFVESRFIGKTKLLSNTELRFYLPRFWEDGIRLGLGPFVDVSRIINRKASLSQLHPSAGAEITIDWKGSFLLRVDYALSSEGGLFYIQGRHIF